MLAANARAAILGVRRLWRVRLVVRTQPSQGWCTGSTPVRAAISLGLGADRSRRNVGVVIVLVLALLLRLVHMGAALKNNFVGKQFAVDRSVMAGDQGPLRTGIIVAQQRRIQNRVAADGQD